jgi:dienelactone hydrolase
VKHDVYRKGQGPCVLVISELPGITPMLLGFADRLVARGLSVTLPDLFGIAGRDPLANGKLGMHLYGLRSGLEVCVSGEFTTFATGRSSKVVDFLRALGAEEHARAGGPGIGVIGMCFSGGFALAMATDARVLAPVLSQPSLPLGFSKRVKASIDCSDEDLSAVKVRCEREGLRVLGLRFESDPLSPRLRFERLKQVLGDGFEWIELPDSAGHPASPMMHPHSVLTVDLIDEPGQPTRAALDKVLALFTRKLLGV